MELIGGDATFEQAGIEVVSVSCHEPKSREACPQRAASAEVQEPGCVEADGQETPSLDEFETGMYLCRWPNGEFSLIRADTRRDALIQLDEWAGGRPSYLCALDTCMVDFHLNDSGEIQLKQFGEETEHIIWDLCYPELDRLLSSAKVALAAQKHTRKARNLIRRAVHRERTRLWSNQPEVPQAKTAVGRDLQRQMGMVGPVDDYYIEQRARRILESKAGEDKLPN